MTNDKEKEQEVWRDVVGYDGLYQVSSIGRTKSFKAKRNPNGKLLTPFLRSAGNNDRLYYAVCLIKNGIKKTVSVHILMGDAFFGVDPLKVTDHKDNISTNNTLENLQRVTERVNLSKDRTGTSKYTGVSWDKRANKWVSQIYISGKKIYLGRFQTEMLASDAYQKALKTYE